MFVYNAVSYTVSGTVNAVCSLAGIVGSSPSSSVSASLRSLPGSAQSPVGLPIPLASVNPRPNPSAKELDLSSQKAESENNNSNDNTVLPGAKKAQKVKEKIWPEEGDKGGKHLPIPEKLKRNLEFAKQAQIQEEKDPNRAQSEGFELVLNTDTNKLKVFAGEVDFQSEVKIIQERSVGVCSSTGYRGRMEDEHIIDEIEFRTSEGNVRASIFGVFDGHGGKQAATYMKQNLSAKLTELLEKHNTKKLTQEGIYEALKEVFPALDKNFKNLNCGTTVTVALIINEQLWVANIGDARIVLSNNGEAQQLTEDAKPTMPRYKNKIKNNGGEVLDNRVNGVLAVARAVGDGGCVGDGKDNKKVVVANPKIACVPLSEIKNGTLVLACDGLFDVATTGMVVKAVNELSQHKPEEIAKRLCVNAVAKPTPKPKPSTEDATQTTEDDAQNMFRSKDNVTVMVVKL